MERKTIHPNGAGYPASLSRCLGDHAPASIHALGDLDILRRPKLALFCSVKCPGDLILKTYDLASALRDAGITVISGFHSPMEKECLRILLRGQQPVIICPARSIEAMRVPGEWKKPLGDGRLLILSPFDRNPRRITAAASHFRNEFVAAVADKVVITHATPSGRMERLCQQAVAWARPVLTLDDPENALLISCGAKPATTGRLIAAVGAS